MIEFLANNWPSIIITIALVIAVVITLTKFFTLSKEEQVKRIKEWLLYAVTTAEAELGGGTGKLKFATVYDMFVGAFPVLKNFISVDRFSTLVDEVLEDMRHMLETNKAISEIVLGETVTT